MKKITVVIVVFITIVFSGCQAVFTYSPFSFLQRDISSRPVEVQVSRAREALSSGDTEQMAEA